MTAEGTPEPAHRVAHRIRSELGRLGARNGHHVFEDICREFSQLTISRHVLPATGPVGRGGDQGRDFETFRSFIRDAVDRGFAAVEPIGRLAFTCTIQRDQVKAKIRDDVRAVMAGMPVVGVYAFCEADLPVADRHELQHWAQRAYGIELDIIDGNGLAKQLAKPDTFPIAVTHLHLPEWLVPPPGTLTLTAPQAGDSFLVRGITEINERARTWALSNRYLLCGGVPHCAHGLYLMDSCPGDCRDIADFDHVTVWMPAEFTDHDGPRAFLLSQPYQKRLRRSAHAYGSAHGLKVEVNRPGDGWYGHNTLAVRMTIPGDWTLWPLECAALSLMGRARPEWGVH